MKIALKEIYTEREVIDRVWDEGWRRVGRSRGSFGAGRGSRVTEQGKRMKNSESPGKSLTRRKIDGIMMISN